MILVKCLTYKLVVLILGVVLLSTPGILVFGANSTIIFSDNFESGNFSAWSTPIGSPKISTSTVHSGTYAANFSYGSSACYEIKTIEPTNVLNYTYYVFFNPLPTNYTCQVLAQDANGRQIYYRIQNTNGAYYWSFSVASVQVTNSSTPSVLSGQWYKIQLLATAGNNCTVYFLVNDQLKATITNQTLSPINQIRVGNDWIDFGAYIPKGESYFDDILATNSIVNFISAYVEGNGSITPSGAITVPPNGNQSFSAKPNEHFHLADMVIDDRSIGLVDNYTFTNVSGIHSIKAVFAIDTFPISASAGIGGGISPSGNVAVDYGSDLTFRITPNSGYHIADVRVNGLSVGVISSYTFTNVQATYSIAATFDADPPPVTTSPRQTSPAPTSRNSEPTATPTPTPSTANPTPTSIVPIKEAPNSSIDFTFIVVAAIITIILLSVFLVGRRKSRG